MAASVNMATIRWARMGASTRECALGASTRRVVFNQGEAGARSVMSISRSGKRGVGAPESENLASLHIGRRYVARACAGLFRASRNVMALGSWAEEGVRGAAHMPQGYGRKYYFGVIGAETCRRGVAFAMLIERAGMADGHVKWREKWRLSSDDIALPCARRVSCGGGYTRGRAGVKRKANGHGA